METEGSGGGEILKCWRLRPVAVVSSYIVVETEVSCALELLMLQQQSTFTSDNWMHK